MGTTKINISRELAAEYGRQALQIIESGTYTSVSGRTIEVADKIARSAHETCSYPPDVPFEDTARNQYPTVTEIKNETTLTAVRDLISGGYRPVALNFASAKHPGGGFLTGARAQEEYLARSSGLYGCLKGNAMYEFHIARRDPVYTNYAVYSPDVTVFRSDDGELLDEPYSVGIITSPAANAKAMGNQRASEILPAMWPRILKVLSIGIQHGHDAIVLGAWGCGAFGNDGHQIASLFHKALSANFKGAYKKVVFAILDWSPEKKFIGPFCGVFGASE